LYTLSNKQKVINMATRGTIAVEFADGTVQVVYSHWDNYINGGTGECLINHWNSHCLAVELIQMGGISSLGDTLYDSEFYCRDRGEPLPEIDTYASVEQYRSRHYFEEYNYLMDRNGVWHVAYDDVVSELAPLVVKSRSTAEQHS
jgi:hypothetical protein